MDKKTLKEKADSVKNISEDTVIPERKAKEQEIEDITVGAKKRGVLSRVMAIIALAILAALFVWFIICVITGSQYTMAVLFCLIIYPILLYIALWLKKVFSS